MRSIGLALASMMVAAVAASGAMAQTAGMPRISAGDSWVYQQTREGRPAGWSQTRVEVEVVRAGPSAIEITTHQVGSTMPPADSLTGPDWSRTRNVNGHQTLVNRPLAFPLSVGKTWEVDYTEDNPNREHSSEHFHTPYRVVGWEDVTVPAGTFHALKIEADGQWSAAIAPAVSAVSGARVDRQGATTVMQTNRITPSVVSGRTYKGFWYAPEVKRWVKSVEEYFDANGVRNQSYKDELISYKLATP